MWFPLGDSAPAWAGRGAMGPLDRGTLRLGYDGVISIEHEDRAFEGTEELVKRGSISRGMCLRRTSCEGRRWLRREGGEGKGDRVMDSLG